MKLIVGTAFSGTNPSSSSIDDKTQQTLIIPLEKNENLEATCVEIAERFGLPFDVLKNEAKADFKEVNAFFSGKYPELRIFLLGMGESSKKTNPILAFRHFAYTHRKKISTICHVDFASSNIGASEVIKYVGCAANGLVLSTYNIGLYKSEKNTDHSLSHENAILHFWAKNLPQTSLESAAQRGIDTAHTQMRVMDLVNAAPNYKTPKFIADWASESGKNYGYTVNVFDKKQCEAEGLHALLAVNRGSGHEPRFIVADYAPSNATITVGLVGKGVTFDTGGISIKPSSNMHLMKSDMGGAGAVLGAIELVAKLKLPVRVVAIVPSTENMVDGEAIKPGEVISSHAGKTIEVIDTDAEGRLILADGLSYMVKNIKPDYLIDVATLTGSVVSTLGYAAAGLFTQNDTLAQALAAAGEKTCEQVWRLPMWDLYFDEMKSEVADILNFHGKPMMGAITAAKFLEFFTQNHAAYAHLDIAGTAFHASEMSAQRSSTAYGVRLLVDFIENLQK
jgi:leucyl aminopeptidase